MNSWCQANGLSATSVKCSSKVKIGQNEDGLDNYQDCTGEMSIKELSGRAGEASFRCNTRRAFKRSYSFFDRSNITIQDVMVFIKSYLDNMTLLQCSIFSGISYRSTRVNWASLLESSLKSAIW